MCSFAFLFAFWLCWFSSKFNFDKNVVLTPHLGASTDEAQINVALDVANQVVDVLSGRNATSAINIPALKPQKLEAVNTFFTDTETYDQTINTLAEIQKMYEDGTELVSTVSTNTNNIDNINKELAKISKMQVLDIASVDPTGEKEADGWLKPNNDKLLLNTVYTRFIYQDKQKVENIINYPNNLDIPFKLELKGDWWAAHQNGKLIEDNFSNCPELPNWLTADPPYPIIKYDIQKNNEIIGKAVLSLTRA